MRPLILIAVFIALLAGIKLYSGKEVSSAAAPSSRGPGGPTQVDLYLVTEEASENVVYSSGTMVPNEQVDLQSEASGRLIELNIKEGRYIKKGALIARIDASDLLAQKKKLELEQELAEQIESRQKKLLDIDAISREEYDISINQVNTLGVDIEFLNVQIAKTEVRAPFSGYIGFKNVSLGAYLTPGVVIASLMQTNPIKLDFDVPEKYAQQVTRGTEVLFTVDGIEGQYKAKVDAINPQVDEDLRTLKVRAKLANSGKRFLPGMFARIEVPLGTEEVMMVPTEAVVPILKGKKVYVYRSGKVVGAEITTGVRTDQKVQILEGLELGDSVIVSALMSIREGLTVVPGTVVKGGT